MKEPNQSDNIWDAPSDLDVKAKAASAALDIINKTRLEAEASLKKQREEFAKAITKAQKELEDAKDSFDAARIEALGADFYSVYKEKAEAEDKLTESHEKWFGGMIILMAVVACCTGFVNWHWFCDGQAGKFVLFLENIPKFALLCLPIYAATIWFACYKNFKANASKRLAELYRHKQYIGATFVGLTSEIRKIGVKNADAAADLMINLVQSIIEVYRIDPILGLKGVKAYTPASEAAKVINAATGFIASVKKKD